MAVLEIDSELFASRLAELLGAKRRGGGLSRTTISRRSAGRFTSADLRRIELGRTRLTSEMVEELTRLYDVDLGAILPERAPMSIAPGALSVGGMSASFVGKDPSSLLKAYLQLVRSLRQQKKAPIIVLRREDIESLAVYLGESGEDVLDRLAALMGATRSQRTSMTALFSTGAVVIGLVGASAAAHHATSGDGGSNPVDSAVVSIAPSPIDVSAPIVASPTTIAESVSTSASTNPTPTGAATDGTAAAAVEALEAAAPATAADPGEGTEATDAVDAPDPTVATARPRTVVPNGTHRTSPTHGPPVTAAPAPAGEQATDAPPVPLTPSAGITSLTTSSANDAPAKDAAATTEPAEIDAGTPTAEEPVVALGDAPVPSTATPTPTPIAAEG